MPGDKKTTEPEGTNFVRGADGTLYVLTDEQLAPYRVTNQEEVNKILADEDADVRAGRLSSSAIIQIQAVNGCVKVTAASDPLPDVYTNRRI